MNEWPPEENHHGLKKALETPISAFSIEDYELEERPGKKEAEALRIKKLKEILTSEGNKGDRHGLKKGIETSQTDVPSEKTKERINIERVFSGEHFGAKKAIELGLGAFFSEKDSDDEEDSKNNKKKEKGSGFKIHPKIKKWGAKIGWAGLYTGVTLFSGLAAAMWSGFKKALTGKGGVEGAKGGGGGGSKKSSGGGHH
jgi:hypothetical protein